MEAGQTRRIRTGEPLSDSLREKAKTPQREGHLSRRWGRIMPQFPTRGFGGRTLHRRKPHPIRRRHPRLPGQVPAARLQVDRVQVLLEWIGRATLRADADEDKPMIRPGVPSVSFSKPALNGQRLAQFVMERSTTVTLATKTAPGDCK